MFPRICDCIISIVLVFGVSVAYSQDSTKTIKPVDTLRFKKYIPSGLRIGTDLISIIKSRATTSFTGWEVNADVDFYKYYLTVDYGSWSRRDSIMLQPAAPPSVVTHVPYKPIVTLPAVTRGKYENQGHYFRIGTDINILLKDPDRNMVFFGLRYGISFFNESLNYHFPDSLYGIVYKSISANKLTGHWLELTSGLRVKIFPGFWMGYTARLKFAPSVSGGNSQLKPYDIPGYGLAQQGLYWGFNYQLFWRIPFRKIKTPVPK